MALWQLDIYAALFVSVLRTGICIAPVFDFNGLPSSQWTL